jgi:hypothetical protein
MLPSESCLHGSKQSQIRSVRQIVQSYKLEMVQNSLSFTRLMNRCIVAMEHASLLTWYPTLRTADCCGSWNNMYSEALRMYCFLNLIEVTRVHDRCFVPRIVKEHPEAIFWKQEVAQTFYTSSARLASIPRALLVSPSAQPTVWARPIADGSISSAILLLGHGIRYSKQYLDSAECYLSRDKGCSQGHWGEARQRSVQGWNAVEVRSPQMCLLGSKADRRQAVSIFVVNLYLVTDKYHDRHPEQNIGDIFETSPE